MGKEQGKRARGRPKTVDRQRAIEVAMATYWAQGLHATSLNEMCRLAGISKPGLYREFGGEDGLMVAALEHYRQGLVVPLLALVAADTPFAQLLDQLAVVLTSERGTPAGCLFTEMRMAGSRLGPLAAARVRAIEDERREAFEARYRRALDAGEANVELAPEFAARYLDNQLTNVLLHMGAGESAELVREQARLALKVLAASGP